MRAYPVQSTPAVGALLLARSFVVLLLVACMVPGALLGCRSEAKQPSEPVRFFDGEPFPKKLSAWHLFRGAQAELVGNDRVLPYELETPLFSDHARKHRTIWMPEGKSAPYTERGVLALPEGTILSKTFYYTRDDLLADASDRARTLIETRLLVHTSAGWRALPYVWNADQEDAELRIAGELIDLAIHQPDGARASFTYAVPNIDECAGCHVVQAGSEKRLVPIGPMAANLDRKTPWAEDQLQHLAASGYLTGLPAERGPPMADWSDTDASLDARARAYLHVQCAHCHSESGPASTSGLILTVDETRPVKLGRCKTPVAAGRGSGGLRYDIVPGQPERSILLFRMDSREPDVMMPELGRSLIHQEGVALIRAWIAAMPRAECT